MGCPSSVTLGDNLIFSVCTHLADTSALTDADAAPAYRVYEDETATAVLTGTMATLDTSNTTGFYSESIAITSANGFSENHTYTIYVSAAVGGVTGGLRYAFRINPESADAIVVGEDFVFSICTHSADTGALTDADTAPTYRVYEAETGTAILTGTMATLDAANTTGFYTETIATTAANGFEYGKSYNIYITATVAGVTGGISYGMQANSLTASSGLDILEGDVLVIGSNEYAIRFVGEFDGWGITPSFRRMANIAASTKRAPAISSGKRGSPVTYLTGLTCTQLDPAASDLQQRIIVKSPYVLKECFVSNADGFLRVAVEDSRN